MNLRKIIVQLALASAVCAFCSRGECGSGKNGRKAEVCYNQAVDYFDAGDLNNAIALYKKAIQFDPEFADAFYGIGTCYLNKKNFAQAFENFEEALFIDPAHADAHYGMGVVYPIVKKDPVKAVEHFKEYLRLRPKAPDAEKVEDWIDQLQSKGTIRHDEEMVGTYNEGIEAFNDGRYGEAEYYYRETLKKNPHYAPAHHALGLLYVRAKRYAEAAKAFEETLMIDPYDVEAHYDLGVVYPMLGEYDKAIFHFTQYMKMNPGAADKKKVKGWIEKIKRKKAGVGLRE
jgi:tetratricopeptide (TPR) repeat protein